ncbi:MAG TPA: PAS domain S-box protein, partial [Ignavibacteriaceae bacterium]|nr:PAS domain S-box protein [Ignavibacteriaceae bacterium]
GVDYRGERVLADLREIKNTPWLLVSKIDLSEIYKPVSNRLSFILIFLFPLVAVAGLFFLYFQSRQNYKDLLKLNESNKKFETLYQTSNDSILIIENEKIINCNAKSEEIFKAAQSVITSKSLLDFSPEFQEDGSRSDQKLSEIFDKVNQGEPRLFEWILINSNTAAYCEINLSLLPIDEKKYIVAIVRDITRRKNAEQALNESEERYRSLFQNNHSIMLLIDPETGRIMEANPAALNFYGYSHEELTGLCISDINQLPQNNVFREMQLAKTEKGRHFFFKHKLAGGQIKDVEVFSGPISFNGKTFLYSIVHDITERKVAEDNIRKLSAGIEQSPASIVITDINGKIEYVNPKFTALTGYTFEEVKGKNPRILKSGKMTGEEYIQLWKTISGKKNWSGEFLNKKKNGELYWESALISPILNEQGEITNYIAIKEDITDVKKADEAFKKMTAELMQQNRNLEQFTYIMSHNLRTPVANIIGISDAMQHVNLDDNEKSLMMKGLFSSVKKLDEVILDLSNILQVKQGVNEKKEKVSFSKLVEDIKTSISALIEAEHVEIKTDFSEIDEILTLKSYLYSIFYNLILNSIKYKRIDSNPLIEITSFKSDSKLLLTFKDNGIGIDLKKKGNEVFGMYKRFHTHTEGKGMGLFMTKMQTETLGGKIQIQSEVNKGTEFKIEFEL